MAWKATALGTGLVLVVAGGLALVSGLGVTLLTPSDVDASETGVSDGDGTLSLDGTTDDGQGPMLHAQNAVHTVGAVTAATGFVLLTLGTVVYGVARVARIDGE